MRRIDDLFERAKERLRDRGLVDVLAQEAGVLINKPKSFKCILPSHDDRHPSATIYENEFYKCFGCDWKGGGIDLLGELLNLKPNEVARLILGETAPSSKYKRKIKPKRLKLQVESHRELPEIALSVLKDYWGWLVDEPLIEGAVKYLKDRGLCPNQSWQYGIRSTRGGLVQRLREKHSPEALSMAGFTSPKYSFGANLGLLIPVWLNQPYPVCWRYRPAEVVGKKKELAMAKANTPYGLNSLKQNPKIVMIVEGTFDYLTAYQWSYEAWGVGIIGLTSPSLSPRWIEEMSTWTHIILDLTHKPTVKSKQSIGEKIKQQIKGSNVLIWREALDEHFDLNDRQKILLPEIGVLGAPTEAATLIEREIICAVKQYKNTWDKDNSVEFAPLIEAILREEHNGLSIK